MNHKTMKGMVASIAAMCVLTLASCGTSYDVEASDALAAEAATDSVPTPRMCSRMIDMLEDGYSYMRERAARAAFERNPSEAVTDVINIMGDSTMSAVATNSAVFLHALSKARLTGENAIRYKAVKKKYAALEASVDSTSAAGD